VFVDAREDVVRNNETIKNVKNAFIIKKELTGEKISMNKKGIRKWLRIHCGLLDV
jgi:hypothetical protein